MSLGNPLASPLGNPLNRRRDSSVTGSGPDLVLRRSSGTGTISIPDGYKFYRLTLIAPGGAGNVGAGGVGGNSGQGGGVAQTFKRRLDDVSVTYSFNYSAFDSISTASIGPVAMTATKGRLASSGSTAATGGGQATISPAEAGVAVTAGPGLLGTSSSTAGVPATGANSGLPGIAGFDAGGGGAGGGGIVSSTTSPGGTALEGALPSNPNSSSTPGAANDVVIASSRNGSLGALVLELWKS